jgi:hypothetical protein
MKPNTFQDKKFPAEKWPSESPVLLWASSHSLGQGVDFFMVGGVLTMYTIGADDQHPQQQPS